MVFQREATTRTTVSSSTPRSPSERSIAVETDVTREHVWDEIWKQRGVVMKLIAAVRHGLHQLHQRLLLRVLPPQADVLELGCGTASLTLSLASRLRRLVGLDISDEALRIADAARERLGIRNAEFVKGDCRSVPFENAFDLSWSAGLIEHFFDDDWRIANEHLRAVKPGGTALMSVPSTYSLHHLHYLLTRPALLRRFWPWSDVRHFQKFYSPKTLTEVGRKTGQPFLVFYLPPSIVGFFLGILILQITKVHDSESERTS